MLKKAAENGGIPSSFHVLSVDVEVALGALWPLAAASGPRPPSSCAGDEGHGDMKELHEGAGKFPRWLGRGPLFHELGILLCFL